MLLTESLPRHPKHSCLAAPADCKVRWQQNDLSCKEQQRLTSGPGSQRPHTPPTKPVQRKDLIEQNKITEEPARFDRGINTLLLASNRNQNGIY